ncbi:hypothetical protein VP01_1021g5 [Puccinia sorghi]|uniref:Uncharacterized protein n=1 Tax=Puccinia sorghi TaxID=27349 RepID=A0A0L6VV54_9BASI|nr:hypothetical protein VP01_1021g5 [Puccinia sorghi]
MGGVRCMAARESVLEEIALTIWVDLAGGGYDLGGTWRPHTGRSEWVSSEHGRSYPGALGGYDYPYDSMYGMPYNYSLYSNHYHSPLDYYDCINFFATGSYNSLAMYEEQLRMMQGITEAERLARWQARIQFEELCEEVRTWNQERALRYALMADEERRRLGLWGESYCKFWASRYAGGYNMPLAGSHPACILPWDSSRLPLSSCLSSRFSPMYGSYLGGYGLSHSSSVYGGRHAGSLIDSKHLLKAQADRERRFRQREIAHARQTRRLMLSH